MAIIKNIGYLWHKKYVDWYHGHKLIGYPEKENSKPIDFAYQAGIYALYDTNFKCIYVGQAGSGENYGLYKRLKDHTEDYLFCRWERFSWFGFYSTKVLSDDSYKKEFEINTDVNELMNVIESLVIHVNPPLDNMDRGSLKDAEWYYQEAEFEERQAEFKKLQGICNSLKREKR